MATVTVWNEYRHERENEDAMDIYPDRIHEKLADVLTGRGHDVQTATLDEPEHGLSEEVLEETEVLIWWAPLSQDEVDPYIAARDSTDEDQRTKLEAFVDAIEGDAPLTGTTTDALRLTAVTEAAYESDRSGEPVPVELDR